MAVSAACQQSRYQVVVAPTAHHQCPDRPWGSPGRVNGARASRTPSMVGSDDPAHDDPGRQAPARCAVAARPTGPATPPPKRRGGAPHRVGPGLHGRDRVHGGYLHPWALLPVREFGCGSVTTCWRRLPSGPRRGCERLQALLLDKLGHAGGWTGRGSARTLAAGAPFGGPRGRNPVGRAEPGSKRRRPRHRHGRGHE